LENYKMDPEVRVILANDIMVNDTKDFATWGTSETKRAELQNYVPVEHFRGVFDGQGHTISGIYCCVDGVEDAYSDPALINRLYETGTIRNLNMKDCLFYSREEQRTPAAVVAYCMGTVENCHVSLEIMSLWNAALLCSTLDDNGVIRNCSTAGNGYIFESGNGCTLGGIVSHAGKDSLVENCVNYAHLFSDHGVTTGGIAAFTRGDVTHCTNFGYMENTSTGAGIVGILDYSEDEKQPMVTNCLNVGEISALRGNAGGIVGTARGGVISQCENRGRIRFFEDGGGLCSNVSADGQVIDCLNTGEVVWAQSTGSDSEAGGIAASCDGTVMRCCNVGDITGGKTAAGTVARIGDERAQIESCYHFGTLTAQNVTDETVTEGNYEDFDFDTVWNRPQGENQYPTLRNLPKHDPISPLA